MTRVDASEAGAGAFFAQQKGEDLVIFAYFCHRFDNSQGHYCATLQEFYAVCLQSNIGNSLFLGTTFRLPNRSCGKKIPLLVAGYIEHVNTMDDRFTVL